MQQYISWFNWPSSSQQSDGVQYHNNCFVNVFMMIYIIFIELLNKTLLHVLLFFWIICKMRHFIIYCVCVDCAWRLVHMVETYLSTSIFIIYNNWLCFRLLATWNKQCPIHFMTGIVIERKTIISYGWITFSRILINSWTCPHF